MCVQGCAGEGGSVPVYGGAHEGHGAGRGGAAAAAGHLDGGDWSWGDHHHRLAGGHPLAACLKPARPLHCALISLIAADTFFHFELVTMSHEGTWSMADRGLVSR